MKNLPKLHPSYWALMLLCTTMGELIGNLISRNFQLGYTQGALLDVLVLAAAIALFLTLRLTTDLYYWLLILIGNIGGTNLADWVTLEPLESDKRWGILRPLQLGTKLGSVAVMGALISILVLRYLLVRAKGNRRTSVNVLYWIAILLSSTFGTTSGDLITNDTPLGALGGSIFLLILLGLVFHCYRRAWTSKAAAYWSALVLMHPIGATIGNYISKPIGLNFGNVYTNGIMAIAFCLIFLRKAFQVGFDTNDTLEPQVGTIGSKA